MMIEHWITKIIDSWAILVVRQRMGVLVLSGLLLIGLGWPIRQLTFDNSPEMWFVDEDPALKDYKQLKSIYGDGQYLVIGLSPKEKTQQLIHPNALKIIQQLTNFLEAHKAVTKVDSLTNYRYFRAEKDALYLDKLIEDLEAPKEGSEYQKHLISLLQQQTLIQQRLISKDLHHSAIIAKAREGQGNIEAQLKLVEDVRVFLKLYDFEAQGYEVHLSGLVLINERVLTTTEDNADLTRGLMVSSIVLLLILFFRTWEGLLMPMVVVVGSVVGVMGTIAWLGWNLNLLNVNLPALLIAVGIGDAIHIITEFYRLRHQGKSSPVAATESIQNLFIPCFYTTLTTAVGFLALTSTHLVPLKEYGIAAAIGVWIAFFFSVTTLPALMSFAKGSASQFDQIIGKGIITGMIKRLPAFIQKTHTWILLISCVLLLVLTELLPFIEIDSSYKQFFKKESSVNQSLAYFENAFQSSGTLEILVDSGKKEGLFDLDYLKKIELFQNYLETLNDVGKAFSSIDYLRQINKALHEGNHQFYTLPEQTEGLQQLLYQLGKNVSEQGGNPDRYFNNRYLLITVQYNYASSSQTRKLAQQIQQELTIHYPELNAAITGNNMLHTNRDTYILQGLVRSFLLAFGIIILCFIMLLRSFKYVIIALVPSIFPILIAGSLMALFSIQLNFSTMIIAALTFGIIVDDTIHFMMRYQRAKKNGQLKTEAIQNALLESGQAITFTSIILFFGFGVNIFSAFVPNVTFGFLGAVVIVAALIADLLILPSFLLFLRNEA
ncbi:MMPL family transporter [Deltaproteobacteria bacterium TL4]